MIIGTNFKLSSKKYLDNRQQCASLNDLIINKDSILYPQGFEVYCIKEKAWYQNVSEGDTPEWKIRQSGTSEGGASIDDTKISATTTWSSEYIYDMKLELQDLITQTEDYVAEIDDRLLYVEGRLTSIGSFDGSYDSLTNKPEFPSLQGYATHEYVDEAIANIGKIEGTKDYNELINQPINNVAIEYIIDGRLIVNVDYLKVGKWYIVNTDLNEEYNSATSFSLVYYLSSDSYSIINTFENEDMHSLIYVSSEDEKEIKIKYITVNGETYELIYNKETNEKTLNLLSSSGNGNGGFSGDYNDLENRPCYEDKGDIPEYLNIEIYSDTDFSDKESIEVINGTADNGNCIVYRKYVKLFSDITIDMINTMKEYGVFITEYEGQLIEDPLIDILDESQADRGMYSIGREFEFILQSTEGYYLPENGLWYEESYIDRDLNGNLIAEYKTVDDFNGILLIKDNGKLNTGTIKQLDEKFIPNTIARIEDVNILIEENGLSGDYNDLKNRPCYDDSKLIEYIYDGDSTDKLVVDGRFVKISDDIITYEEFKNSTITVYNGGTTFEIIMTEEQENEMYIKIENETGSCYMVSEAIMMVILNDNFEHSDILFPEKGIYFIDYNSAYTSKFSANKNDIKQLDEKFIPDTIARIEDVNILIEENGGFSGDYNDLENRPCYGDAPTTDIVIEKTITDFSYENRDVVEIGALYAGWNNDLETRVFVNICQDFNEDDMKGLLNNGVFIDNTYFGELYECPFVIDAEGYGNIQLYDKGCYFYTPYSSTIDFILVTEDNYIFGDGTPLSRGIWLNYVYYGGLDYIDEFVKPDGAYITFKYTTKSVNNDSFKQLDEKYIPDSIKDYNNLSNVPCIDSRKIKLEKFDIESICNKGIGDSIAEEFAVYDKIEIADGVSIFKINDEPLFTYDDFLYCYLHTIEFDDNYIILGRSINSIKQKYELDYLSSYYIDSECYDPNKFLFIQDGLLIVFEDDTSILLKTGNTITLSKGSYGVMDENRNSINGKCTGICCELELCRYVGEFKELDEKFIKSHLDNIHDSMVGGYHIRNNEKLGESFNSYGESYNRATGKYSHAEGFNTRTSSFAQHVQGKYNIEDTEEKYAHIIGNGTDYNNRSNAHTLDWSGNAWYQGNISIEGTPTNDNDLTTKKYVDDLVSNVDIDLSDYITNTELEGKGYITEIPSEYITNTELEGKGYITEIPVEYITETELTSKGYVTETDLEEEMVFETDSLTVNALGGISANTDLNGLTVKEILNKLLYPYIEPVITVTATPNGGTYEKGSTQTITNVKVVVTKKSEKITKIEVLNGTQVIARQNDEAINNGGTFNYNVNVSVPSTNKQLTVKVTDNSGNAITKTTNAFTFVYPYYYGVCDEGTTINGDLIKSLTKSVETKGTKAITYTTNNQRMIFAYPKSYGVITKILDPNSFDVTSTFTMSQITIIGLDGTGQSYYVYVNSPSTVSNFNMKFSY